MKLWSVNENLTFQRSVDFVAYVDIVVVVFVNIVVMSLLLLLVILYLFMGNRC